MLIVIWSHSNVIRLIEKLRKPIQFQAGDQKQLYIYNTGIEGKPGAVRIVKFKGFYFGGAEKYSPQLLQILQGKNICALYRRIL